MDGIIIKRKSPVQMLMNELNKKINFKHINVEEWEDMVKDLELAEEMFALEITYAYSAGYKHGMTNKSNYTDGMDYHQKRFGN